jgi:protein-S-isoprenylcysteine O-methyltransferase Ste14
LKPVIPKAPHIQDKRIWDLAAAAPLIILCVIAASGFAIKIQGQWPPHSGNSLLIGSEVSSAVFLLFQAGLLCVRRLPLSKMQGIAPRVWALAGANFSFLILLFPRVTPTPLEAFISSLLVLAGTLGSILSLIWLGRAFAIFPQARILVTAGPYTLVRHPLYLAEQISAFGLALQFQQPWGLLIVLVGFIFQFPRMHFEEKILAASFPAYRAYAGRTARILPFLY